MSDGGSKLEGLTAKQRRFCLEYLKDKNGSKAAIRAGYAKKYARIEAWGLLKKPEIRNFIRTELSAQESRLRIDLDRIVNEAARIALFNGAILSQIASGELKPTDLTHDEQAAISEYTFTTGQHGITVKVKAHAKAPMINLLYDHFSLFDSDKDDTEKPKLTQEERLQLIRARRGMSVG